jgi:FlaA1/EpsC-like NDP-sugar epimerase
VNSRFFARQIENLPRPVFSRTMQVLLDGAMGWAALLVAYLLRFDWTLPPAHQRVFWLWGLILCIARPASAFAGSRYKPLWRYFSMRDTAVLALSMLPVTAALFVVRLALSPRFWWAGVPATVIVLEYCAWGAFTVGLRMLRRTISELALPQSNPLRTYIVGSDRSVAALLPQFRSFPEFDIVGILAPDKNLVGLQIAGVPVLGDPEILSTCLARDRIDLVLIADAPSESIAKVIETTSEFGTEVRLLPSADRVMNGDIRVQSATRPELLARERHAAPADSSALVSVFGGRTVLVTGAGGSIGSEISRQVSRLADQVLLLDRDENSIFEINRELAARSGGARVVPLVGDIRDAMHMELIFRKHRPSVVLHAAAYKHVPVMEDNCSEAVLNNITGTRRILEAAMNADAERFVMISTDKAVHPSSVMGTTKRVAELMIQQYMQSHQTPLRAACVRFGNVLGSRGSVVPIFLRQIEAGGPVTITHHEMTRYFITIPEAVQLVLRAATLGCKGTIYMLDMGDPLRIRELAERLIELSGMRPDKDIKIEIVGTRPGEKIHEVMWHDGSAVSKTEFPNVLAIEYEPTTLDGVQQIVASLERVASSRDEEQVRSMIVEFMQRDALDQARATHA